MSKLTGTDVRQWEQVPDAAASRVFGTGSLDRLMDRLPSAFAVTRGADHLLVYTNAAFRRMAGLTPATMEAAADNPIGQAFGDRDVRGLVAALDAAIRTRALVRDHQVDAPSAASKRAVGQAGERAGHWLCTVWPELSTRGEPERLVIELHAATQAEHSLALQRSLTERMLLSALREGTVAAEAEASLGRVAMLAGEAWRLSQSFDETATLDALARLALSVDLATWCIVDMLQPDGTMRRGPIVHGDPVKQPLLDELKDRWVPDVNDGFGLPAMLRGARSTAILSNANLTLSASAPNAEVRRALETVSPARLLTVPLNVDGRVVGAITFADERPGRAYAKADVELVEDLAARGALAVTRAREYAEAIALRAEADLANRAKSDFLRAMSHDLRTPLNAIGGYADLMDLGLHGPVTNEQRVDLARIINSQRYLTGLIEDILNFAKVGSGELTYDIENITASGALAAGVALVEPLFAQKGLVVDKHPCDTTIMVRADSEKVSQILVNLLSNAIRFTPRGGHVGIACDSKADAVRLRISDTGIGIPSDRLGAIFQPFFQVKSCLTGVNPGVGLGLAISRDLARAMHGDLTVESTLGEGSRFTLTLPRGCEGGGLTA